MFSVTLFSSGGSADLGLEERAGNPMSVAEVMYCVWKAGRLATAGANGVENAGFSAQYCKERRTVVDTMSICSRG